MLISVRDDDLKIESSCFTFSGNLNFVGSLEFNGLKYTGMIENSKFEGSGCLITSELTYKGMFKHSKFDGEGRLKT